MSDEKKIHPIESKKRSENPNSPLNDAAEENVDTNEIRDACVENLLNDGNGSTTNPKRSHRNQSAGLGSSSNRPMESDEEGPGKVLEMPNGDVLSEADYLRMGPEEVRALFRKITLESRIKNGEQWVKDEANERIYIEIVKDVAKKRGVSFESYKAVLESKNSLYRGIEQMFYGFRPCSSNVSYDPSSVIGGIKKDALDFQKEEKSTQEEKEGSRRN